ncbi:hypothetical protein C8F04DRAFT_1031111 [Mycena alexandri]|uniref:DNA 3'-5' helicase n=1 Tax=Mycena alexandri TaxID=1745969 RepID=A0AAD6T9W8_9AGAR|nr:hypothetical protein C8F04DRAFT_1031111 [Mycena alexandri]
MSENNPPKAWPPRRLPPPSDPTPGVIPTRTALNSVPNTPIGISHFPRTPLSAIPNRKIHRNGYETAPKTPSFIPFALNNIGHPRQKPFTVDKPQLLPTCPALDPSEWTSLAIKAGAIPANASVRGYQVRLSNLILRRGGDAIVIAPTGSGKSLTWTLPLLARKGGISLVITPYRRIIVSLNHCDGITSTFIYSEQNTLEDFERVAQGDMQVVYVCPEMLESPSFARLLHSPTWRSRLVFCSSLFFGARALVGLNSSSSLSSSGRSSDPNSLNGTSWVKSRSGRAR